VEVKGLSARLQGLIRYMGLSAGSYDGGVAGESQRLALCVRAFIQEAEAAVIGGRRFKDMRFHDEAPEYKPALGLPFSGLAVITIGKPSHRYTARLGNNGRFREVSFDDWWGRPVLVDPEKGISLSRASVVEESTSIPAGPGDRKLDQAFGDLGLEGPGATGPRLVGADMAEIESASVRQIAYELLLTLEEAARR
jgi:hypothetical protein